MHLFVQLMMLQIAQYMSRVPQLLKLARDVEFKIPSNKHH